MKGSILLLSLFLLQAYIVQAHRENSYYLFGHFGDTEVCVAIDEYGEACMARYFTFDDRYDHVMEGTIIEDNWFEMYSYSWDQTLKERVEEDHLLVKELETDVWQGSWKSKNGLEQVVQLSRIVMDSLHHPYADIINRYNISPYSAYRTKDVHFEQVEKDKLAKGAEILHVIDPASGIKWFRVLPNNTVLPNVDSINGRLIADQINAINSKYSCVYLGTKGDYEVNYSVNFLNSSLISYTTTFHSACYGGPDDDVIEYHTLSVNSASEVMLENLYWFGNRPQPKLSEGEYKWTQYRYKVFTPKLVEIMKGLYPDKFSPTDDTHCSYDNMQIWYFPEWGLTKKGLYLLCTSPLSSNQCKPAPSVIIPYKNMEKYKASDFGL